MNVAERIKKIRTSKKLSQKEVTITIGMGAAQYSRIENGKTDPSISTLMKIGQALGVSLAELFAENDLLSEINSTDRTIMEKVKLMESLDDEEKQTMFSVLDAFITKRKMKNALSNALKLA
jgi:transcriptional regulator with XRE-family HTH domain